MSVLSRCRSGVVDALVSDAGQYGVPDVDALLLALNLYGLCTPLGARVRLQLSLITSPEVRTVVVAAGRSDPPFTLSDDGWLYAAGVPIGRAVRTDADDAVSGYLRCWKHGTWWAATINPAGRSRCTGCAFCPTSLEPPADPVLTLERELHALLDGLELQLPPGGTLRSLHEVAVSTACYRTENAALEAMVMLRKVLRSRRINARIVLLSSVLRSREAFRFLAEHVAPFGLFLTAECVSRRDFLLKNTKADLLPEAMPALLAEAGAGLDTSFTYIAGLDTTVQLEKFMTVMLPQVTLFPSVQIFQPHKRIMDRLLSPEAECLGYYYNARRVVENIMTDLGSPLTPELWRCYRSLWATEYAGHALTGPTR